MRNLDPAVYVDPAVFTRECERIFWSTWQLIGPASRLAEPGQYVATEIAGGSEQAIPTHEAVIKFGFPIFKIGRSTAVLKFSG